MTVYYTLVEMNGIECVKKYGQNWIVYKPGVTPLD